MQTQKMNTLDNLYKLLFDLQPVSSDSEEECDRRTTSDSEPLIVPCEDRAAKETGIQKQKNVYSYNSASKIGSEMLFWLRELPILILIAFFFILHNCDDVQLWCYWGEHVLLMFCCLVIEHFLRETINAMSPVYFLQFIVCHLLFIKSVRLTLHLIKALVQKPVLHVVYLCEIHFCLKAHMSWTIRYFKLLKRCFVYYVRRSSGR